MDRGIICYIGSRATATSGRLVPRSAIDNIDDASLGLVIIIVVTIIRIIIIIHIPLLGLPPIPP